MQKPIAIAVAAFLTGAVSTGVIVAQAQQAPADGAGGPPGHERAAGRHWSERGDRMDRAGPHGMMMPGGMMAGPMGQEGWHHRMEMMRAMALVPAAEDRKLSPADVTKIAEGFLLWKGNHSWKVLNAAVEADQIGFDLATKDGSVIAHFTMDPKTGALKRVS
jgi:hypothetical protein